VGLEMNRAALERQMQDRLTSLHTELTQRCGRHDAEVRKLGWVSSHDGRLGSHLVPTGTGLR
jgi:hypothetical protein